MDEPLESENEQQEANIPLDFCIPPGLISRYATNIVVQHTEHEFVISFFEVESPILLGSEEEKRAKLQAMDAVQANCVARVVIAPTRMEKFVEVLSQNLEKYKADREANQ